MPDGKRSDGGRASSTVPTARDVARLAGVSTATVSRVVSGDPVVSPKTVTKVNRAIKELSYHPNAISRALRARKSRSIALVVADIENPFLTAIIRGVESVARAKGYSLLLFNSDEDAEREMTNLTTAKESRPAGVLITPVDEAVSVDIFLGDGVPVVAVDRPLMSEGADSVVVETRWAARRSVEHLRSTGRTRIALITGPRRMYTADERYQGWREGLGDIDDPDSLIRYTDFKVEGGWAATHSLFEQAAPPDGLVVANSLLSVGALRALGELGLSIYKEVGFVAFDDAPWTGLIGAPMSIVKQPAFEMGEQAARLLFERIEGDGKTVSQTITLHPTLAFVRNEIPLEPETL
jgi:Transcriptional regulators